MHANTNGSATGIFFHFSDLRQPLEQGSLRKTSLERLSGNAGKLSKMAEKLVLSCSNLLGSLFGE